jgi:hypothetical protein
MTHTAPEHVRHGAHNDSRVAEKNEPASREWLWQL